MHAHDRYDSLFIYYGEMFGIDWRLLKAQAKRESNFDPDIVSGKRVSSAGAMGIAQFMPRTWRQYGEGLPSNPEQSIKAQAKMMRDMMKAYPNEVEWALACYNWGIGNVRQLRAKRRGTFYEVMSELPKETQDYVTTILSTHRDYLAKVDVD
jgi:soluble lytic murein transglycosylase-like protein